MFGVCTEATPQLAYPGPDIEFRSVLQSAKHVTPVTRLNFRICFIYTAYFALPVGCTRVAIKGGSVYSGTDTCFLCSRQNDWFTLIQFSYLYNFLLGATLVDFLLSPAASQVPGLNLLLGGHDHTPFVQTVGDCLILKCGENADRLGVIDVKFSQATNPTPSSSVSTPNSVARPLSPTSPFSPLPSQPSAPPLPPYSMSFAMIANENDPDPSLIRLLDKYVNPTPVACITHTQPTQFIAPILLSKPHALSMWWSAGRRRGF